MKELLDALHRLFETDFEVRIKVLESRDEKRALLELGREKGLHNLVPGQIEYTELLEAF